LVVNLPQVTIEVEFFGKSFCAYRALKCGLLIVACYMDIEVLFPLEIGVTFVALVANH